MRVSAPATGSATAERPVCGDCVSVGLSWLFKPVSPPQGESRLAYNVSGRSGRSILLFCCLPPCHDLREGRWSQWRERDRR